MKSKFLRLDAGDLFRGMVIAVICSFITGFYEIIANEGVINWLTIKPVIIAAVGAGLSYLTKNMLSNSRGDFLRSEPVERA